ncbi:permease-like cell division protein FtsX [Actinoplanes sp. RD1]|uniref:permease-like cell division protein FtsX n=1 Tax=Actinoplanes sp. RD1 TaxID=3064538 RepID=UPI0027412C9B|nr:permease-like cell division protein FtsX [Actinoplanes sp. RD1]
MENLRDHFEYALSDDPGIDAGQLAHLAIAEGGRVRRRRQRIAVAGVAAGVVAALGVTAVVHQRPASPAPAGSEMLLVGESSECRLPASDDEITDPSIFLTATATAEEQSALAQALGSDPRAGTVHFESREEAFQKFQRLWRDSPDFVQSVGPESLPGSFRLRLTDARDFPAFRDQYLVMPGVQDIAGITCPANAPIG